jgi:FKBP-type peptidyl-prolyl cis-trans isomerase
MARKRERAFAGFGAILFLVTSSALTIGVVVSLIEQNKSNSSSSTSSSNTSTASSNASSSKEKTLEGTKLEGFTPTDSVPKLEITDLTAGTGEEVKASDTITVDYTGALASTGVIFQSSKDTGQPVTFPLNQVIAGWTQGIPGMKVGGTRQLLIPASLAYGANPPSGSGIPANANLVFDVTLHSIKK